MILYCKCGLYLSFKMVNTVGQRWGHVCDFVQTVGHRGYPLTPRPSSQSTIQTWLNAKKRKDDGIFKQTLRFN